MNGWLSWIANRPFEQLADALSGLPPSCPQEHSAAIAHWRGKVALIAGKTAEAVPHLALAATLESERAANFYLLGAALVRQQQWLDARSALQRALDLQPGLRPARLELATVLIAIGELCTSHRSAATAAHQHRSVGDRQAGAGAGQACAAWT